MRSRAGWESDAKPAATLRVWKLSARCEDLDEGLRTAFMIMRSYPELGRGLNEYIFSL
jgi:hypothetical protein